MNSSDLGLPGGSIAVVTGDDGPLLVVVGDEDVEFFPVSKGTKRKPVRFAFGVPGRRGTIWRMWSNANVADVYLGSRTTTNEVKVSLHASGDWRLQVVDPERPKTVHFADHDATRGRILSQWQRPEPDGAGWTKGITLALPGTDVGDAPGDDPEGAGIRWCQGPVEDEQGEFEIWIVEADKGARNIAPALREGVRFDVVDTYALSTGEVVVLLALVGPRRDKDAAAANRLVAGSAPPPDDWDRSPEMSPRTMVHGNGPNGAPMLYDLAYSEPGTGGWLSRRRVLTRRGIGRLRTRWREQRWNRRRGRKR